MTRAGARRDRSMGLIDRSSDEQLVAMVRLGDDAAFEAIVGRYRAPLLGHCRRVAGGSRAQDALQQAFLSAWRALRDECDVRDLRRWLFTIAHRAALQARREEDARLGELPRTRPGSGSPAEDFEQSVRVKETLAAIAALPPLERDALVSTAVHGRSGRDAAHALGVSEAALRQLVFRARARTRAAVRVVLPMPLLARLSQGGRASAALVSGAPASCPSAIGGLLIKVAVLVAVSAPLTAHLRILPDGGRRPATSLAGVQPRGAAAARAPSYMRAASTVRATWRAGARWRRPAASAPAPRAAVRVSTRTVATLSPHASTNTRSSGASSAPAVAGGVARAQSVTTPEPAAPPPVGEAPAQQVVERVAASIEQATAPVHQVAGPVGQVVESAVVQLQTLASANGSAADDAQQVESVAAAAIPDEGSTWVR